MNFFCCVKDDPSMLKLSIFGIRFDWQTQFPKGEADLLCKLHGSLLSSDHKWVELPIWQIGTALLSCLPPRWSLSHGLCKFLGLELGLFDLWRVICLQDPAQPSDPGS